MTVSAAQLNRATIVRQGLAERHQVDPVELIGRLVGVQGQDPVSVYLALWNRIADFDPDVLDRAFTSGEVVRCTLMRLTLHAVRRQDHAMLAQAMQPTLRSRLGDPRFTGPGLLRADIDAHEPAFLDFVAAPRTSDEIKAWFAARLDDDAKTTGMVWAIRSAGHVVRATGDGPWSFATKASYRASPSRPDRDDLEASDTALGELIVGYLGSYGPATIADVAQFAMVPQARARRALTALGERVRPIDGPARTPLLDLPGSTLPDPELPVPPRLLGMWDNVLLAHVDRTRLLPTEYRKVVTRVNGDVLPTVLVDGHVAGVWRSTADGIEVTAFRPLLPGQWSEIDQEAAALWAFLTTRDPAIYRRHDHWWSKLPGGDTRLLGR